MKRNDILCELWTNAEIDDIIKNITGGHHLSEDLKSEVFLILSEMAESKLIEAWTKKWIKYLIINILIKQWRSQTSPFHKKFRPPHAEEIDPAMPIPEEGLDWNLVSRVIIEVEALPFVERELIKMRYKLGEWGVDGKLEDKACKKVVYSYRKMEKKLKVGDITIDHNTIQKYHNRSIEKIKKRIGKNDTRTN